MSQPLSFPVAVRSIILVPGEKYRPNFKHFNSMRRTTDRGSLLRTFSRREMIFQLAGVTDTIHRAGGAGAVEIPSEHQGICQALRVLLLRFQGACRHIKASRAAASSGWGGASREPVVRLRRRFSWSSATVERPHAAPTGFRFKSRCLCSKMYLFSYSFWELCKTKKDEWWKELHPHPHHPITSPALSHYYLPLSPSPSQLLPTSLALSGDAYLLQMLMNPSTP